MTELAARQDHLVHRRQLAALGVTRGALEHRLRTGHLTPVHRQVYAVGPAPTGLPAAARAALMAIGDDAMVSHRSAAALWGMCEARPGPVAITTPRAIASRAGIDVHRSSTARAVRHLGLRVTPPARTVVDLGAVVEESELARALAEAQVLRLADLRAIAAEVAARPTHRGAAAIRRLLDTGAAPTRSELERALQQIVRAAGLTRPQANARIGRWEVDALWRAERVVVETDGWDAHHHRAAFERDRAKDAALAALGHVVLRFTWRQLRDEPVLVGARLAQTLAVRR